MVLCRLGFVIPIKRLGSVGLAARLLLRGLGPENWLRGVSRIVMMRDMKREWGVLKWGLE